MFSYGSYFYLVHFTPPTDKPADTSHSDQIAGPSFITKTVKRERLCKKPWDTYEQVFET